MHARQTCTFRNGSFSVHLLGRHLIQGLVFLSWLTSAWAYTDGAPAGWSASTDRFYLLQAVELDIQYQTALWNSGPHRLVSLPPIEPLLPIDPRWILLAGLGGAIIHFRRRILKFLLTGVIVLPLLGYADGTVEILDAGQTTLTVSNSGPRGGGSTLLTIRDGGHIWFSVAGFPQAGSTHNCNAPCTVSINMEYGKVSYWHTDSSGNNPSSVLLLPFVPQATATAPFTTPTGVHGFTDYEKRYQFAIANGVDVSALRIYLRAQNLRQGLASVISNSGVEHILSTTGIVGVVCGGAAGSGGVAADRCLITTEKRHSLSTTQVVQLSGFREGGGVQGYTSGDASLNNFFVVQTVPTAFTFTIISTLQAGDWNTTSLAPAGTNVGKTVSATTFYADEKGKYFGGIDGNHQTIEIMVPVGATEFTANVNNTLGLRFKGDRDAVVHGYWANDFNVVQPDCEITQIVVSGSGATHLNAVATCNNHGYVDGETVLIRDAPGPRWRFNGYRVITAHTTNTFTFLWGSDLAGEISGVAPYDTPNGTYVVPQSSDPSITPHAHMYAARCLIPKSSFTAYNPATQPTFGGNVSNGATFWVSGVLKDRNRYLPGGATLATCRDCHSKGAFDMKYFGFPEYLMVIATLGRGGTEQNGKDVAAYMTSNDVVTPAKGRPWNGTYQPCPGIDAAPAIDWSAGCGDEWVLTYDKDMREWYGTPSTTFDPAANLNWRETPVYLAMPWWIKWLPGTHPKDFFALSLGVDFSDNDLSTLYDSYLTGLSTPLKLSVAVNDTDTTFTFAEAYSCTNNDYLLAGREWVRATANCNTTSLTVSRHQLSSSAASHTTSEYASNLTAFQRTDNFMSSFNQALIGPNYQQAYTIPIAGSQFPAQYGMMNYDVFKWAMSRKWELLNVFRLQDMSDQVTKARNGTPNARAAALDTRGWQPFNKMLFDGAPHRSGTIKFSYLNTFIQDTLNWVLDTNMWYQLQAVVTTGNRMAAGNGPIDIQYQYHFYESLSQLRPAFYLHAAPDSFNLQNIWGWTALFDAGAGRCESIESLLFSYSFNFFYSDLLTSESDKDALVLAAANRLVTFKNTFSTGDLQAFITGCLGGSGELSRVPDPAAAYALGTHFVDTLAYALPIMRHYNVPTGTTDEIVTWANALFTSGHNFATDTAATCSLIGVPPRLKCNNIP